MGWYGDVDKDSTCNHCRRRVPASETMYNGLCRQCHDRSILVDLEKSYTSQPGQPPKATVTLRRCQTTIVLADVTGQDKESLPQVITRAEAKARAVLLAWAEELTP